MQEKLKENLDDVRKETLRIEIELSTGEVDINKEEATQKYLIEMIKKYRKDPLSYRK